MPVVGLDYDTTIENENVLKHEAPVCLDLGQPVRWRYWDMNKPKPIPELARNDSAFLQGLHERPPQPYSGAGVGRRESVR